MQDLKNLVDYHFNDTEPIRKQFVAKCAEISKLSGVQIDPYYYFEQFDNFSGSIAYFADIQTELYAKLKTKYPELEFGIRGRTKAPLNYYEKVIKKLIQNPFEKPKIYDQFANKIFLMSVQYSIDSINIEDEKVQIESDKELFDIDINDCFDFLYKNSIRAVLVEDLSNIIIDNGEVFILFLDKEDNTTKKLPLSNAIHYRKSSKDDLVPYCYEIRKDILEFYETKKFERKKTKNYIKSPKESGYESIQDSYYSTEYDVGIETQIKTFDMDKNAKDDPMQCRTTYKPGVKDLNNNSIYRVPKYALTTGRKDTNIPLTYTPAEDVCFKYTFDFLKEDYLKLKVNNFDFQKTFGMSKEDYSNSYEKKFRMSKEDYIKWKAHHFSYEKAFGMSKEEFESRPLFKKVEDIPSEEIEK